LFIGVNAANSADFDAPLVLISNSMNLANIAGQQSTTHFFIPHIATSKSGSQNWLSTLTICNVAPVNENNYKIIHEKSGDELNGSLEALETKDININDIFCHGDNGGLVIETEYSSVLNLAYSLPDGKNLSIVNPLRKNLFKKFSQGMYLIDDHCVIVDPMSSKKEIDFISETLVKTNSGRSLDKIEDILDEKVVFLFNGLNVQPISFVEYVHPTMTNPNAIIETENSGTYEKIEFRNNFPIGNVIGAEINGVDYFPLPDHHYFNASSYGHLYSIKPIIELGGALIKGTENSVIVKKYEEPEGTGGPL
jgi:hypothetical protein